MAIFQVDSNFVISISTLSSADFSFKLSCRVSKEKGGGRKKKGCISTLQLGLKSYEDENRSDFSEPAENDAWRLYSL